MHVHTSTSGRWFPDGGLQAWVVGNPASVKDVGLNGSIAFELPAGQHEIEVFRGEGERFYSGCSVDGGTTRLVQLGAGETALESFELFCEVVLELTSSTTGASPDPDGYRLLVGPPYVVDQDLEFPIRSLADEAPLILDRDSRPWWNAVPWASDPHTEDYLTHVYVWDIAPNCTLLAPNPLILDVGGGITSRELEVECADPPPATGTIYYMDADVHQVVRVGADGSGRTQVTNGPEVRYWTLSPDGTQIVFSPWADGGLYRVGIDGSALTRISPDDEQRDEAPDWGVDGRIIYDEWDPAASAHNIFSIRPDGSDRRKLTAGGGRDASLSPDGSRIVFDGPDGLTTMNADGSDQTVIRAGVRLVEPRWSPDGTRIAGVLIDDGRRAVVVLDPGAGELTVAARRPLFGISDFAWAPDGSRVVYFARSEAEDYPVDYFQPGDLYSASAEGRNLARLVADVPWSNVGLGLDWRE